MRATNSPRRHPAGFTLIELLVVISIIGILMGLLLGAVQKVRDVGKRTTVVSEINQLDMAATKFKLDFGFNPPQYIRLPGVVPDTSDTTGWQLSAAGTAKRESYDGFRLLLTMFPRWQIGGVSAVSAPALTTATGLVYRGTAAAADENGLVLEGSQSLAFFLGGPDLQGFTPSGPTSPAAGATSKKGPYFDFVVSRMDPSVVTRVNTLTGRPDVANGYLNGYLDPYGTPYAYFSTASANNYDLNYGWVPPLAGTVSAANPAYVNPVRAYQEVGGKPINSGRVQIISAGRNKRFGPGTVYVPGPPASYLYWRSPTMTGYQLDAAAPAGDGGDDLANFNGGAQLGVVGN